MTNVSDPAAQQYAIALYQLGTEKGEVGSIFDELSALNDAYTNDREFRNFFTSPKVPSAIKLEILNSALGGRMCETMIGFVTLLVHKGRETLLDNIHDAFAKYRDDAENRVHVWVESADVLDEATIAALADQIASSTGKAVAMHSSVNIELIGGMRVRIGDALVDNSLSSHLKALSARLMNSENFASIRTTPQEVDAAFAAARAG